MKKSHAHIAKNQSAKVTTTAKNMGHLTMIASAKESKDLTG